MDSLTGKPNLPEAIRLLAAWTRNRFDIWNLSGSHNAGNRAIILSQLTGVRQPQSKSGVNALREAFYVALEVTGTCMAHREDDFIAKAKSVLGQEVTCA